MNATSILAALVIGVGLPLNLYVTIRLWGLSRASPELRVLRERAVVAVAVLLLVIVFGLIFVNNDLVPPPLSFENTKFFTRITMLIVSVVPAAYWLWLYRK